jgi:small multidrug resistance pump
MLNTPWVLLTIAIVADVVATSSLKLSDGFTRIWPSVVVVAGYGISFYCLSVTMRSIPIGVIYALWSGLGVVLITLVGWLVFKQHLDLPALIGISLIIAGVVIMNVWSKSTLIAP